MNQFGVEVDSRDLTALARDLKVADKVLRRELLRRVRGAGRIVERAVKEESAFSSRIPGATYVRSTYAARGAAVKVGVDKTKAPEAKPINNADKPGTFRHPVFADPGKTRADWTWVPQASNNFMSRAIARTAEAVGREIEKVYTDIAHRAGFRGL